MEEKTRTIAKFCVYLRSDEIKPIPMVAKKVAISKTYPPKV
jgi:hypothetical protein